MRRVPEGSSGPGSERAVVRRARRAMRRVPEGLSGPGSERVVVRRARRATSLAAGPR
jgi:hypothetical protein